MVQFPPLLSALLLLNAAVLQFPAAHAQVACLLEHCAGALAACELDAFCRRWSNCNRACSGQGRTPAQQTACQIRCGDLYKPTNASSAKIDAFSECVISEFHCVPQTKETCPEPAARGLVPALDLSTALTGVWYITRGKNPLFDCFDCQVHDFYFDPTVAPAGKPLHGDLKYNVKTDLNCTNNCTYLQREVHQSFGQDP